ncbi:MAG: hypothetical protein WBD86_00675 [Microgenomates group bacterium]
MDFSLEKKIWWGYLGKDLQELLHEAVLLVEKVNLWDEKFHDYSFVVFPAAKAYEGFLKRIFLDRGFIDSGDYYGKRFRVGKALNPSLERRLRKKESVYDRIVKFCGGRDLADKMWDTWKSCRNLLFHWFPNEKNAIDFSEAKERVSLVIETIDATFKGCKMKEIEK